ncbi:hypothetical protein PR202_ga07341 [Eleusine coracana subsp. coracana]|uniref:At1g61320/AtMIF1 LRR domain-containing protein n=1 Tax=Eleusine coracana subsp. coracana TaxID=191504 RepID=A0AAV5BYF3_ELECO|nr:hypothetical protein PR202_ga07341 [Eleusine coracana subsp. coracana]
MRNIRACSVAPGYCLSHSERYCERRRASDHFENLPENLLSIILSKLPLNEVMMEVYHACNAFSFPLYTSHHLSSSKFSVLAYFYDGVEPLMRLPKCTYRHLKDAYITGFVASKGQLEFLEHVAENAPALEVLTVDTRDFVVVKDPWEESHSKEKAQFLAAVRGTARSHVEGKIPPTCCMRIH